MTEPRVRAEQWLSAALSGGLPEPSTQRWQPLRVGIVNLWEYDKAEFWFADGRLVLRGGNGAGKTKVLELTTLMLLRGEIVASALDPFGSQHRTMRFNLLPTGEADDPRPQADSGLGYAWAEFGRRDEQGQAHYFVCGLGASAKRATGTSGVTRWQLITHLRPGRDLALSSVDRPLEQKDLKKIDGVRVMENAGHYRALLAGELFGLSSDAYDNLTELLKQLRKPKLGERLNPASLAETLRDALPPLAGNEITQLAEGWDRLEQLRDAVDQTKNAALHVAQFVRGGWLPWARIVVRRRADVLTSATTKLDHTTKARRAAEGALLDANKQVEELEINLGASRLEHQDLNTELRELLDLPAFHDARDAAKRVENLGTEITSLQTQETSATSRAERLSDAVDQAAGDVEETSGHVETAAIHVSKSEADVVEHSDRSGLTASTRRHLPEQDLVALRADLDIRTSRFSHLRDLEATHGTAEQRAAESARHVHSRAQDVDEADVEQEAARGRVETAVDNLRQQIREWAIGAAEAACTDEQVETWCDQVSDLTVDTDDTEARPVAPAVSIVSHLDAIRDRLRGERESLTAKRGPLADEHRTVTERLSTVRAQTEQPPPASVLWQRRERPHPEDGHGAALWQCVVPVDGVEPTELDRLEASLAASGLLDAWLTPDGTLSTFDGVEASEIQLRGVESIGESPTLATVLEPAAVESLPNTAIRSVLASIGWHPTRPAIEATNAWLAADGSWRIGPLTGRAEPTQPASYLGATAREAARLREIGQLESRLGDLTKVIDNIETQLSTLASRLSTLAAEGQRVPLERPVTDAVSRWRVMRESLEKCQGKLAEAQSSHQKNESKRDSAWAEFADYAAQHRFPVRELDDVATAFVNYRAALDALTSALQVLGVHRAGLASAKSILARQQHLLGEARSEITSLSDGIRQVEVKLRTAREALGADHQQMLDRRDTLDSEIVKLNSTIDTLGIDLRGAMVKAGKAEDTLATHEERRQVAETERDQALTAWWETFDAGLTLPIGLFEPDRRNVTSARDIATATRRDITVAADDVAEDRAWRRCYAQLQELRQSLLPNREARVDDVDGSSIQQVVILADSATGWQAPHAAADTLAERVSEQEHTFDAEQQRVLTTLLGSTFIEHLKDRLDYTEQTFGDINKQLAAHPTRQGHAVRLAWGADPADPDAGTVVSALTQGYHQLSTARQETVRSFLARKIDAARADAAADGTDDWKDQLTSALDYRGWLKISLQYRPGSTSAWAPFDSAKHGAKSGGEKVVLLSQPLFAAAVVAYNAASDIAPRWVWLDEAMTGVDEEIKASFMGLTVSFDLDIMLTAHDEWCKYQTVPAVAVYDLARQKGLPGVDAMPYLWCGGEWTRFDLPVANAGSADPLDEGLFATADAD